MHLNPVRRALVERAEEWRWSSAAEYLGVSADEQGRRCGLVVDRTQLRAEARTRI
jgi:hypothetical protein